MTALNRSTRRSRSRAVRPVSNRSAAIVVALMMALVFIPVLALHAAALSGTVPNGARPGGVVTAATPEKAPG